MAEEHEQSLADKLLWWLIGGMATLIMAGLVTWVSENNARLKAIRDEATRLHDLTIQQERQLQLLTERQEDSRQRLRRLEAITEEYGRRLWWAEAALGIKGRPGPGRVPLDPDDEP